MERVYGDVAILAVYTHATELVSDACECERALCARTVNVFGAWACCIYVVDGSFYNKTRRKWPRRNPMFKRFSTISSGKVGEAMDGWFHEADGSGVVVEV